MNTYETRKKGDVHRRAGFFVLEHVVASPVLKMRAVSII